MKFTDLCIYIDENVEKIKNPGEYPEIENTIYNYLWLVVKALAIKKHMFNSFSDYDPYAFYAAGRLFLALRNNLKNQGQVIKGREIRPIKSCLNYTKALLNPMKIDFQDMSYSEIISEEFISKKFDAFTFKEQLKCSVEANQGVREHYWIFLKDTLQKSDIILNDVLKRTPFLVGTTEYDRVKISILINCNLMLNQKGKLGKAPNTIILWKLPKSMNNFIRLLINEFIAELKKEIMECYKSVELSEGTVEKLLKTCEGDRFEY